MQTAKTFLMFSGKNLGKAEEAIKLYTSIFDNSIIDKIERFQKGEEGGNEGTVKEVHFTIAGQQFMAHDSPLEHPFNFTPSISIYITFDDDDQINQVYSKLKNGGSELMPLDNYGFSKKFGWIEDKYGINWQLNLE